MRKRIVSAFMAALLLFALAACGGDPAVGTWKMQSVSMLGLSISAKEYQDQYGAEGSPKLIMNKDGTYSLGVDGSTFTGTWRKEDGAYKLSLTNSAQDSNFASEHSSGLSGYLNIGIDLTLEVEGKTASLNMFGVEFVFAK